jgi:hypothetical protein
VKLGKNASDTCAVLFESYVGEAMKKSSGLDGINCSKIARRKCATLFPISRVFFTFNEFCKAKESTKFSMFKYVY